LLAVPLAVGMGFVYLPLNAIASRRAQLEWLDQQILGLRERSQERARLLEEEAQLRSTRRLEEVVIEAATPALAAADLQAVLTGLIRIEGGEVTSVQIGEPRKDGPFTEIRLRMVTRATLANLRHLLYSIETMTPLLLLDNLVLRSDPAAPPGEPLEATIEVLAWTKVVAEEED
jgi:hypothetical protein